MVDGIKHAIAKDIPVVIVSRCFEGRVFESYGYEGGGKELKEIGCIFGDVFASQKARIKLIVALNYSNDMSKIKSIFESNIL